MFGRSSLNHMPLSPCWAKVKSEGATGKFFWPLVIVVSRWPWRIDSGRSSPRRFSISGLGSNRSICEGAPDWKRKMIRFAFGGNDGNEAAAAGAAVAAGGCIRLASAAKPSPPPAPPRNTRRLRAS